MVERGRSIDLAELLPKFKFCTPIRVRFCETDANRHVNQVSYFVYIEQARMDYFTHLGLTDTVHNPFNTRTLIAADLTCEYLAPAFFGQTLHVHARVTRIGRSSLGMEYALVDPEARRLVAMARGGLVFFDHEAGRTTPLTAAVREAIARLEGLAT
jgi:acyl-CoA thioester hydrolase